MQVVAGEHKWLRQINPAQSYLSSSSPLALFGLGNVAQIDAIRVTWPDAKGTREEFTVEGVDRTVVLRKGKGRAMTAFTRRRWLVVLGAAVLLAGSAAGAWKWWHRSPPPDPPMPADIQDAEVLQAVRDARQKVLNQPNDGNAWGYLGKTLLANLFDQEADRCFAEAARLDPRSPDWPYGRGLIALRKDPDNALPFLRKALSATGDFLPEYQSAVRLQLAEALLERHQLDEAEQLFRAELARHPANPRAAFGLGQIALARATSAPRRPS